MKNIYFLLYLLFMNTENFSQNIDTIFTTAQEIDCGFFTKDVESKIVQPIKGDIINFFSLNDKYDTPLKKKKFYENKESWILADSLKKIKESVLRNWWKIEIKNETLMYDLEKKALMIGGIDACFASTINNKMADFNGVYFPMFDKLIEFVSAYYIEKMKLYLPMNEDVAYDMEENKNDIKFYLLFKVKDDLFRKALPLRTGFSEWVEMPVAKKFYFITMNIKTNKWIGSKLIE